MTRGRGDQVVENARRASPIHSGAVLGIDVGFSKTAKSTCLCLFRWAAGAATIKFAKVGSSREDRVRAFREVVGHLPVDAVAIDGPLAKGLQGVTHYRSAEALLTRGLFHRRGKPGQTSSPTGRQLHCHATVIAQLILEHGSVANARHADPIHPRRIVEAFPNAFLAVMTPDNLVPQLKRDASDKYWHVLVNDTDVLSGLLGELLPSTRLTLALREIGDHDERAALVCAMTALCVVTDRFVAVGDPVDGDIILPPLTSWGSAPDGRVWAEVALKENLKSLSQGTQTIPEHAKARVLWSPLAR